MIHEVGYDKGYMQAEKDYFDRTEKDRQASYDAGYEIGKAEGKAEHDKECDRCLYSLRKETIEEVREEAREATIDECKDALLMAITESYIWSEVAEATKDLKIQSHADNIYDDFEETIKTVLGKLNEEQDG